MKQENSLKTATMQGLVLCPFLMVVLDNHKKSKVNVCTLSYVSVLAEDPPIIGLAIRPSRYSAGLLKTNGEFTLNLLTRDLLEAADFCGTYSGRRFDKAKDLNLSFFPSERVVTPGLAKSPIILECRLLQILPFYAGKVSHEFFIAEVVRFVRDEGFSLETSQQLVVTTNYDYRILADSVGKAHQICPKPIGGKGHAISRKKIS